MRTHHPELEVKVIEPLTLLVNGREAGALTSYLRNAFAQYCLAPDDLDEIFQTYSAIHATPKPDPVDPANIIACARAGVEMGSAGHGAKHRVEPIAGDLYRFACENNDSSIAFLGTPPQDQCDASLDTILALSGPIKYHEIGPLELVTSGGNDESSRILLCGFWDQQTARLNSQDIVFALPSRDLFLLMARQSGARKAEFRQVAAAQYDIASHRISPKPYLYREGRMTVFRQ
ncbi:MAG: hypothetical protein AB8B51_20095 [Sedimentitalea sp.]